MKRALQGFAAVGFIASGLLVLALAYALMPSPGPDPDPKPDPDPQPTPVVVTKPMVLVVYEQDDVHQFTPDQYDVLKGFRMRSDLWQYVTDHGGECRAWDDDTPLDYASKEWKELFAAHGDLPSIVIATPDNGGCVAEMPATVADAEFLLKEYLP